MPLNIKQTEESGFNKIRSTPFTRINGRPSRSDYKLLKRECCNKASEIKDVVFEWCTDPQTGEEYGLLADILGRDEYNLTNIDIDDIPEQQPTTYDPDIDDATPTHQRKRMEEEWERRLTSWYIRKGFLKGTAANLRNALDEQYYAQLRNVRTAYRNVLPRMILEHLNNWWCPLDVQARKQLRQNYYSPWSPEEHLTAFGMRLTNDQISLVRSDVTISDDDKLQFYLKQMYESNAFDKMEMMNWENQPAATKTDFYLARDYFEKLIKSYDTYEQNAGAATKNTYNSANRLADVGDEIREYINQIATSNANNSKDKDLASDVKKLTEAVAMLTKLVTDKENTPPGNTNNTANSGTRKQFTGVRNMGAYCYTHGYHPAGTGHTSVTCKYKKEGHKDNATWGSTHGGNDHWPANNRVSTAQQEHATYKGKTKPTA
jgi:gas vesicle protein